MEELNDIQKIFRALHLTIEGHDKLDPNDGTKTIFKKQLLRDLEWRRTIDRSFDLHMTIDIDVLNDLAENAGWKVIDIKYDRYTPEIELSYRNLGIINVGNSGWCRIEAANLSDIRRCLKEFTGLLFDVQQAMSTDFDFYHIMNFGNKQNFSIIARVVSTKGLDLIAFDPYKHEVALARKKHDSRKWGISILPENRLSELHDLFDKKDLEFLNNFSSSKRYRMSGLISPILKNVRRYII